jgi:hypothetical protein
MTLDVNLVCPACRRFWHGPPGRLTANGPYCPNPDHRPAVPLEALAAGPVAAKRSLGATLTRSDGWTGTLENDRESHAFELFAARRLGVEVDEEIYDGGDGGFDFVWYGLKVDAKLMRYPGLEWRRRRETMYLIVNPNDRPADVYLVGVGSIAEGFEIVGYCRRAELVAEPRRNFGYGPKLALAFENLKPLP